jgi:endonuclease YncB( thermonuclease family)
VNTPPVTYEYAAVVTRVIDGDTIVATVDLGFYLTASIAFRLLGVDTPEVTGPTRAQGLAAAEFTRSQLLGKPIRIRTAKSDSFGRWLCNISLDGKDFNRELINLGFAVERLRAPIFPGDIPA